MICRHRLDIIVFILVVQLLFAFSPAFTQSAKNNFFRVNVQIVCEIEGRNEITESISSYIKRELRSLNDISLSEVDSDYVLTILYRPFDIEKNKQSVWDGYVMCVILTLKENCGDQTLFVPSFFSMQICNKSQLKEKCEAIVTMLDTGYFERLRHSR